MVSKRKTGTSSFWRYIFVSLFAAILASSCGGNSPETVYLWVFNGYAGSKEIALIGPTGTLVSGLKFGQRADADVPLDFDRNLGSNFTLLIDGAPQPVNLSPQLFSMYPQETASIVVSRRSGTADAQMTVLRHRQSVSNVALLTLVNGLSLSNMYTNPSSSGYTIIPEFNLPPNYAGFIEGDKGTITTECGLLEVGPNVPGLPEVIKRMSKDASGQPVDLHTAVQNNNWFALTTCEGGGAQGGQTCYVWGEPKKAGEPALVSEQSTVEVFSNTKQYLDCLAGVVQPIKEQGGGAGTPKPECEGGIKETLDWAKFKIDPKGLEECKKPQDKTVLGMAPPGDGSNELHVLFTDPGNLPAGGVTYRLRTPGFDGIFGTPDGTGIASQANGVLVKITAPMQAKNQTFSLIYGRPISPMIEQWKTAETIVDLSDKPYPNDTVPGGN